MAVRLLRDLLEVEVVRGSKGANLDRRDNERRDKHLRIISYPRFHTYPMHVIPVWDRQRIGKVPILVDEIELVFRQKHGQNQLQFHLGHLYPRARVSTGSPTQERIDSVHNRVGSQPPTGVVLVWFGVVFGVQVDVSRGIREEISPFDHLFADCYILMNVPSEGDVSEDHSL